jgi:hypothetical protein
VGGQVNDLEGAAVAAATLGTFTVNQQPRSNPVPGPIFLDSSTISAIASGKNASVDPHDAALASGGPATSKATPTRAHENLPKHKHKKKKKHHTPVVITVVRRL